MIRYIVYSLVVLTGCAQLDLSSTVTPITTSSANEAKRNDQLQAILDSGVAQGLPGISLAVRQGSYFWEGTAGYAKIEDKTAMHSQHLQYSQSVAKAYTAVLILMLYEEGKLDLDTPMDHYLPKKITKKITESDRITIRQLLNHTSGIHDYIDAHYTADFFNNPYKHYSPEQFLSFTYGRKLEFQPGTRYAYSNANYLLLALMVDHVSGKDHAVLMREKIFQPLGLSNSYYHDFDSCGDRLVNTYFDRFGNGVLENVSVAQLISVSSLLGDDGMAAAPGDYVKFLDGLNQGKLLRETTVKEMRQWVEGAYGPAYGLGLAAWRKDKNVIGYGHSGGGYGAGCVLYHFPEKDITVFMGVNVCTLISSPAATTAGEIRDRILAILLN
jgi:D-alanyl-D-alanine carboxypeptidase